jgi:hypothetical protein
MIYGFRHQGGYEIPDWAMQLKHYYWVIRVEGRDKAKRRRYYRYIAKEKLRLAELNIDQQAITKLCKYLSNFHPANATRFIAALSNENRQLTFNF